MKNRKKEPGKYIGTFTAKGQLTEEDAEAGNPNTIRLFDGRFDTAYVVREFRIWSSDYSTSSAPDVIGKLATSRNATTTPAGFFDASNNIEIAWATSAGSTDGGLGFGDYIIDPENLLTEDIFVYVRSTVDTTPVNYLVVLDKYDITEALGAVTMAKDRSGDSGTNWIQ